jgi:hypothetical protein
MLPSLWEEIKSAFDSSSYTGGEEVVEDDISAKSRLKNACVGWAQAITKLVSLREQFTTSSYSFPHGHSEAVELFDVLPAKFVTASISDVLSFLTKCQEALPKYPLVATEARRWVDLISSSVTMWIDPILTHGSLLNNYHVDNKVGISFHMLSDHITEALRVLVKDIKSRYYLLQAQRNGRRCLKSSKQEMKIYRRQISRK